jgi:hypothetical protein
VNDVAGYAAVLVLPPEMREAEVTVPGVQLFHYITDDQLTTLGDMRKEPVMEICLMASGAFLGAIVPAIEQLGRFNDAVNPMGITGLCTVIVAVIALAVAAVTGALWRQRLAGHQGLVETIQSRKKVAVTGE